MNVQNIRRCATFLCIHTREKYNKKLCACLCGSGPEGELVITLVVERVGVYDDVRCLVRRASELNDAVV